MLCFPEPKANPLSPGVRHGRRQKAPELRILLVEDHRRLASLICRGLADAHIDADSVGTAQAAFEALDCRSYDVMILDLGLPDRNGLSLLKEIRGKGMSLPVLVLTARVQVSDRIKGLDSGADDYLTKPFDMDELVARVHALLRRPSTMLSKVLTAGDISFDIVSREALVGDSPLPLTPRESRVLEQLLLRNGKVVLKENMEHGLYGLEDEISSNSLEVVIHRLRKKLVTAQAGAAVHTVRGVGYMILPENE
jgi:DNA-binding response OmpR family regulator